MRIRDVLAARGWAGRDGYGLISVRPEKPVMTLPAKFAEHNVSSVLVMDARDRLHGIVTDRIFLAAMAQYNQRFADLKAVDIMQSPAPTCLPGDTVDAAMRRMTIDRVRHLVVKENDRVISIVSIGDLVKARINDAELESRVLRELALGQIAAR